jgi:energy-coupling factor transport system ATP-binding protein
VPASAAALDVRDLTVRYPGAGRDALRAIALEVAAGSFVSVAGRNGAGKSTLCLVAAGLLPLVIRADVRGFITGPTPVGLVLADPAAGLTGARASVREEVAFGLENLGVPRAEMDARIDRALAAVDIDRLAERSPESLSGGEQQRVAIAAALAMAPPLLVLDEATAELDPAATRSLALLLRRLAADGTAILAADHASAILASAERTVVLDDGEVVATGPPAATLRNPALAGPLPSAAEWPTVRDGVRPASVELRAVTHRYPNGVEALRSVSLSVPPGEAVAIVGANGSGKSTLAKHLAGLLRPAEGAVLVDGRDVASQPVRELARTVGFLFQDAREQLFGRTVERAVAFGPRNLDIPASAASALVDAALRATGFTDRRDTNPHDLDLAARKQVALAGALAMDPGVFVLDEPTTGQDRPGLARVEAVLAGLRAAGRTIVVVTHDHELAGRGFDRVVVMREGEIVGDGPPGAVLART